MPKSSSLSSSSTIQVADLRQWSSLLESSSRPLLMHLNADTTWLLQLPYPPSATPPSGRLRFNILIDPWLRGPQSDVAWWFSTQWHVEVASVASMADLNNTLRELESQASTVVDDLPSGKIRRPGLEWHIDVVLISHEFTDHCHKATLQELPPSTPIYASDAAADLIRTWKHFERVVTAPELQPGVSWSRLTVGPLPDWIAIGRIVTPGNALYYHAAMLLVFDLGTDPGGEGVIYSPHGIDSQSLTSLDQSGIKALAILHGLHSVRIWTMKQLNLGALNGIRSVAASGAKYWIATHDEVKQGGGFIAPLLQRTMYTLQDAINYQIDYLGQLSAEDLPSFVFKELRSGEGLVLI